MVAWWRGGVVAWLGWKLRKLSFGVPYRLEGIAASCPKPGPNKLPI